MFILGHLGIGRALVAPWRTRYAAGWLALGMLLPDLIDKPLFYAHVFEIVSCTRTFGHTLIVTGGLLAVGVWSRRPALVALGLGSSTHLLLDGLLEGFAPDGALVRAAGWPLSHFVDLRSRTLGEHLDGLLTPRVLASEAVGLLLLVWQWRGARRSAHGSRSANPEQPQAARRHEE